jgi:hypothetical protein
MRHARHGFALTGITLALATGCAGLPPSPPATTSAAACPTTTEAQNVALTRTWHEEAINRRNPAALRDILDAQVRHHAAGGYPRTMTAEGVVAMMSEFPIAFSDLRYTSDFFIAKNDLVVQRYTAAPRTARSRAGRPRGARRGGPASTSSGSRAGASPRCGPRWMPSAAPASWTVRHPRRDSRGRGTAVSPRSRRVMHAGVRVGTHVLARVR